MLLSKIRTTGAAALLILLSMQGTALSNQTECSYQFSKIEQRLRKNDFAVTRDGESYILSLDYDQNFVRFANSLPYESHWLDAGAGVARGMYDLAVTGYRGPRGDLRIRSRGLTALGFEKPQISQKPSGGWEIGKIRDPIDALSQQPDRQFRYLSGRYLEDYSKEEIGDCDLITDVMGPFAYTGQIDVVLKKYLDLLKVGGKAFIHFPLNSTVVDEAGGLKGYLESIGGISFRLSGGVLNTLEITKLNGEVRVPGLRYMRIQDGSPPVRVWVRSH